MAKGNLILGTAKNSVGDVVMYRREGAQITRVRVRNVKNPKTNAQSFQRAIMAPIAKFYSPLSVVLERSFEGLSKAKSHNKFNQVNANLARKNKWALPKGTGFFPLPYQLSQGTLPVVPQTLDGGAVVLSLSGVSSETTTIGALSTALINAGSQAGDVVTVLIVVSDTVDFIRGNYVPHTVQFVIDPNNTTTITDYFNGYVKVVVDAGTVAFTSRDAITVHAGALIVSRFDNEKWRRSTNALIVDKQVMDAVTADAAVAAAIASYGMTAGDGNPLVYLDGDELDNE